jgi:hypothetical protein
VAVANLTLTIDERLLKRARMRALEQDTSVNALVRSYLEEYADEGSRPQGLTGFLTLTGRIHAGSGPAGRSWTRNELHER